jgi:hypothetical protein
MAIIKTKNRRKGPDSVVKLITFFSVLTWIIIIAALIIYNMANPKMGSYSTIRSTFFDVGNAAIVIKMLLFLNIILGFWGIIANTMRNKRKTDRFHISLIVSAAVSLVGFIIVMVKL